jgi:hypothetical protein
VKVREIFILELFPNSDYGRLSCSIR